MESTNEEQINCITASYQVGDNILDAANLLCDDDRKLWLSSKRDKAPFVLLFDFTNTKFDHDTKLSSISFRCWHAYVTNPSKITLELSSTNRFNFVHWQSLNLELAAGTQTIKLQQPVRMNQIKHVRLSIIETHGNTTQTYLNQVAFHTHPNHETTLTEPDLDFEMH